MVGDILQPTHLLFVLVVALLVLGPKRLPEVGRTLGSGLRDFRAALNGEPERHEEISSAYQPPQPVAQPVQAEPTMASPAPSAVPEHEFAQVAPSAGDDAHPGAAGQELAHDGPAAAGQQVKPLA
ncbi:MAG: twin-arginine translocase TatA/TatE family subunit [Solirubrobacteraceae bacterium]